MRQEVEEGAKGSKGRGGLVCRRHLSRAHRPSRLLAFARVEVHEVHELLLRMHAALRVDVARVSMHGVKRDDELIADERTAAPRQEQRGDLRLALGKPIAQLKLFRRLLEDGGELLPSRKVARQNPTWQQNQMQS